MRTSSIFENWMARAVQDYKRRTPKSAQAHRMAQQFLPGGDTRTVTFFSPYPIFVEKGEGCRLYDIDGNVYIDFVNNYTSLIHGHAHPAVVEATRKQIGKGISFASPMENQRELAGIICERVKSVEHLRFCNSGTEATMNAIRAARILSGKSKIVKIEGGYHGTHDVVEISFTPTPENYGFADSPNSVPQNKGIPKSVLEEVIVVPFNNKAATEQIIRQHSHEIACVIVEPMLGAAGCILEEDGYLKHLRNLTRELTILLIFDEVVTFRLGIGGLQGIYGIEPDITAFGKIIGGGFPVGAFGGLKEIMKIFSPLEEKHVVQSGTFNANPITIAAGIATLKLLTPDIIAQINFLGDSLRKGINSAFQKTGIKGTATGMGSLVHIHFNSEIIRDYRSAAKGNFQAMTLIHMRLLEKGFNVPPRGGEFSISTVIGQKEILAFLSAFEESLVEIKGFIQETTPHLL